MGTCMSKPRQKPIKIYVKDKIVDKAASEISIHSVYKLGKNIGVGTFGVVKVGHNLSNPKEKVAVKVIFKNKLNTSAKRLKYEIDILLTLDHPNIIKCFETFEDENHIYIVMEFCSGGELIEIFPQEGALAESDALDYIRRILMAVNHVHRIGIVHRDLKPENFLFSTTKNTHELKLVDFGLSNKFSDKFEKLHSTVGTPFYIAPEVLKSNYDSKCDLWSVGIILYIMLSGDLPFYAENVNAVFKKIESGVFSMRGTIWDDISEESKHLVSRLICLNTHDRLSAQEALMHPAIHKIPVTPINTFDLVGRLKNYSELNYLKKCIFAVFVKYLNFDKIVDQRRAFTTFDRGLSGVIGAIEICDIYEEIGAEVLQQQVGALMSKVGLRHKGKLCFSEFVSVLTKNSDYITEEIIKLTFEFFDRDRKGYFNTKNYIEAIDLLGGKMTIEDAEEQLKAISSMAVVAYEDFKKLL
ncbi:hypothetical protein SteCoe_12753 [Stentor coeruleus]|uniref:non-specific serine/threonine protein kinase n=1 Tax=Stentor coeruleus TaxID=5963 RepID=A0A1R2CA47_9CILI|nr:hypothetical protein SteCoe_12753 [Stentor coeruleus]